MHTQQEKEKRNVKEKGCGGGRQQRVKKRRKIFQVVFKRSIVMKLMSFVLNYPFILLFTSLQESGSFSDILFISLLLKPNHKQLLGDLF